MLAMTGTSGGGPRPAGEDEVGAGIRWTDGWRRRSAKHDDGWTCSRRGGVEVDLRTTGGGETLEPCFAREKIDAGMRKFGFQMEAELRFPKRN